MNKNTSSHFRGPYKSNASTFSNWNMFQGTMKCTWVMNRSGSHCWKWS
jgi:hypothetical protein